MKTHPRREFLLRVLAACGTPVAVSVGSASARPTPQAETPSGGGSSAELSAATTYFGEGAAAARAIGEAYLRHLNIQPTRASILAHTRRAREIVATASTESSAVTALSDAVRRDFTEGRVLLLEGWVLSLTEVELCALTLLPGPA